MKIGTLCKVIKKHSHNPSQYGDLVVVTSNMRGYYIQATNLKTGKTHHYSEKEIEEVKQ